MINDDLEKMIREMANNLGLNIFRGNLTEDDFDNMSDEELISITKSKMANKMFNAIDLMQDAISLHWILGGNEELIVNTWKGLMPLLRSILESSGTKEIPKTIDEMYEDVFGKLLTTIKEHSCHDDNCKMAKLRRAGTPSDEWPEIVEGECENK